jgi:hypothetical protein
VPQTEHVDTTKTEEDELVDPARIEEEVWNAGVAFRVIAPCHSTMFQHKESRATDIVISFPLRCSFLFDVIAYREGSILWVDLHLK